MCQWKDADGSTIDEEYLWLYAPILPEPEPDDVYKPQIINKSQAQNNSVYDS